MMITPTIRRQDEFVELARRRMWLLFLLDGAERAGLTPMPGHRFHRMIFLANALSPVYEIPLFDGEILKIRRGPFYPDLQWDLDRLVFMGMAELSSIEYAREETGEWWLFADYALSPSGLKCVQKILEESPRARTRHDFCLEIAGAYAGLSAHAREEAALKDANFRHPDTSYGNLIEFAARARNFSAHAAEGFQKFAPIGMELDDRDKLHLYFRYLNRMVERAAG
jgi:hypothetical protein